MLRYKEKVDLDSRLSDVEVAVERWRERIETVSDELRNELLGRLRISLIYHDAALYEENVAGMNSFAQAAGLLVGAAVPFDDIVATQFRDLW